MTQYSLCLFVVLNNVFFNRFRRLWLQLALERWEDICFFLISHHVIGRERIHSGRKWWCHWIQSSRIFILLSVYPLSITGSLFYPILSGMIWNHRYFHVYDLTGRIVYSLDIFLRRLIMHWWKVRSNPQLVLYDDHHFVFCLLQLWCLWLLLFMDDIFFLFVALLTIVVLLLLYRPQFLSVLYKVYTWCRLLCSNFFFLRVLWRSIIPYLKDLVLFVGLQMRHCLRWTLQFLLVCSLNSIWYLIQRYTH